MKIIVGLGNPGAMYERTRHNAGFLALDKFLEHSGKKTENYHNKFQSQVWDFQVNDTKIIVMKPQTFMNNSGQAVREAMRFYKADPTGDLIIIHDEIDLPLGRMRLVTDSSAAGHNGVQNIFDQLDTQNITRIRIGIESRQSRAELPTDSFVLSPFTTEELNILEQEVLPKVSEHVHAFITR